MPDVSMDIQDGFETQFTLIMETVLRSAVRETTKLYESTLERLKEELVQLRQEKAEWSTDRAALVDRGCSPVCHLYDGDLSSGNYEDVSFSEDENEELQLLYIKDESDDTDHESNASRCPSLETPMYIETNQDITSEVEIIEVQSMAEQQTESTAEKRMDGLGAVEHASSTVTEEEMSTQTISSRIYENFIRSATEPCGAPSTTQAKTTFSPSGALEMNTDPPQQALESDLSNQQDKTATHASQSFVKTKPPIVLQQTETFVPNIAAEEVVHTEFPSAHDCAIAKTSSQSQDDTSTPSLGHPQPAVGSDACAVESPESPNQPLSSSQGSRPDSPSSQFPCASASSQFAPPTDEMPSLHAFLKCLGLQVPQKRTPKNPVRHRRTCRSQAVQPKPQAAASPDVGLEHVPVCSSQASMSPDENLGRDQNLSKPGKEKLRDGNSKVLTDADPTTLQSRLQKLIIKTKTRQIDQLNKGIRDKMVDQSQIEESQNSDLAHRSQALLSRKTQERKRECLLCGKILSNKLALESHMRTHSGEPPFYCFQCKKGFSCLRSLSRHRKAHRDGKQFKCEECGKSFVYHFGLTKHQLIHTGEKPFSCKICGKRFLAKGDCMTHMRMHTGEKPFSCNHCGKRFKHKVALNKHLQRIRGETPYKCPHCDKGFLDLANFKRHKLIHTGERPYECRHCGKRFIQSGHLTKHIRTQHERLPQ